RVIGIELAPSEVAAQQQQSVAGHQGVIAGRRAEHSGHADIERIVVFDEVLGPRRMRHRRLQTIGQSHQLIMRAQAPRTAVDGNPRAGVQYVSNSSRSASLGRMTGSETCTAKAGSSGASDSLSDLVVALRRWPPAPYPNAPTCSSRNWRLRILPLGFFGSASANTTRFGTLNEARTLCACSSTCPWSSDAPAFGTTTATTASTQCGCGTPITATSDTATSP